MNEQLSEQEIKDAKAKKAGKDVADIAGRAASTYLGGAAGAKVYDLASKTKLGQAALDRVGNKITKNPMTKNMLAKNQETISQVKPLAEQALGGMSKNGSSEAKSSNSSKSPEQSSPTSKTPNKSSNLLKPQNSDSSSSDIVGTISKIKKYWPIIVVFGQILLGFIIIFLVVAILMSGIMGIKETFTDMDDKFLNFVSGCGWSNDNQCNAKLVNNFYKEVNDEYDRVKNEHQLLINRELIIATLTYDNPFFNEGVIDEDAEGINYRKSKRQVDNLVDEMVIKKTEYYKKHKENGTLIKVSSDYVLSDTEKDVYEIIEVENYVLDYEHYRKYLEDKFIIKFYLDKNYSEDNKIKAKEIVDEIFARVELASALDNEITPTQVRNLQTVTVTITDCNGIATLEQTTLYDYLLGVLYMYSDNNTSKEYLSYLNLVAKNYLYNINGASVGSMPTNLRIKSCNTNQLYCNVKEGCHYLDDGTLTSGPDSNDNYVKEPAPAMFITSAGQIIDSKTEEFLINNDEIINTKLDLSNSSLILQELNNSDYKTLLNNKYGGVIDNVSVVLAGYPLDLKYNYIDSLFGWRLHPVDKICKHHNGMDLGAPFDAAIYAYADGVVVSNGFNGGYGYCTIIGHGLYNSETNEYQYYTLYAHQIRLSSYVTVGSNVVVGQQIGSIGSTGKSTGPHLHFEIYDYVERKKHTYDPAIYFKDIQFRGLDVNSPLYTTEQDCLMANGR